MVVGAWPSHNGKFIVAILDDREPPEEAVADRTPIGEAAVTEEVALDQL